MHAMRDRERKHLHRDKKGHHGRLINKIAFLCLELGRGCRRTSGGRQVHPDQTNVVKGQNSKSGHDRHYKKTFTVPKTGVEKTGEEHERKIE